MADFPTDLEIDLTFPDNNTGDISAADMRTFQKNVSTAGDTKLSPDQVLAGANMTVTDNGDGTITLTSSGGGGGGSVPIAGDGIDITDNGDGTYTIAVANEVLTADAVLGGTGITVTDNGDGTITLDASATDEWQSYSQSVGMIAKAAPGKTFPAGSIVQVTETYGSPASDPRFPDWEGMVVDDIKSDASYDLPLTQQGRIVNSTPTYNRKVLNVTGMGIAVRYDLADLSSEYGTVTWEVYQIMVEGNNNTGQNSNMSYEIWGDNGGEPDPNNILVPYTEIDHTDLHEMDSSNVSNLPLNTPFNWPQGGTVWVVTLYDNRNQAVFAGDVRPGALAGFMDVPEEWSNQVDYVTTPLDPTSSKYTVTNGATWVDEVQNLVLRTRLEVRRTSSLEPPTNTYGFVQNATIDDATEGSIITYGPLRGDASGTPVGETWLKNDLLFWNPLTGLVTNVRPADAKDEIIMGTVLDPSATDGVILITAMLTGTRGIYMTQTIYDPAGWRTDAFRLQNMIGTTEAWRINYDNSDSGMVATDTQQALDELSAQLAGYTIEVVAALPGTPDANTIYFVTG